MGAFHTRPIRMCHYPSYKRIDIFLNGYIFEAINENIKLQRICERIKWMEYVYKSKRK